MNRLICLGLVFALASHLPLHAQTNDPPKIFTNSIGMKFVWIPPGSFIMGSPKEEPGRFPDEAPHKVTLTKGFYMAVYPVTQEQWQAVMDNNPSKFKGEANLPVETVSWDDCQEFAQKLRTKERKQYRLPTEAEWEYSCRAGTATPFHFGNTISTNQANYNGEKAYGNGEKGVFRGKTTPVGSFPANAWGLHDMHGNVSQWCQDWNGYYQNQRKGAVDPHGPKEDSKFGRVLRGGCWADGPVDCRSASRNGGDPSFRYCNWGLRVCFSDTSDDKGNSVESPVEHAEKQPGQVQPKDPPKNFTNSIGMKFVWIPPGSFVMGSPKKEKERGVDEVQHKVTLSKGFYMSIHLVTQEQWQAVMGNNPSWLNKGEKNLPVENVSWEECQAFIKKLREKDKKSYRLPSEAEWEYSCRAGTTTPFHFGDTISADQANYHADLVYGNGKKGVYRMKTTPVGSFPANAFGLYDMHGNLLEWCQDWYGDYPQKEVVDPQGPEKGNRRVLRGSSWDYHPRGCRSAHRTSDAPDNRHSGMGCRICFFRGYAGEGRRSETKG